jgi:hypothetical protein
LAKVLEVYPPNVTFISDLVGPRLASLKALLLRLDYVHLTQGSNEFCWNLNENDRLSVDSMYRVLVQPIQHVVNNKLI